MSTTCIFKKQKTNTHTHTHTHTPNKSKQGPATRHVTVFMFNTRQRSGERLLILVTAYQGRKVSGEI